MILVCKHNFFVQRTLIRLGALQYRGKAIFWFHTTLLAAAVSLVVYIGPFIKKFP
jgi:hypothetical protein